MTRNNWTRDELIVAFNLYCKIGFSKIHYTKPEILKIANLLGRTPSSVAFKLVNFARLDPELQKRGVKGMGHGSKKEEEIWNEFHDDWEKLAYESELLIAKLKHEPLEQLSLIDLNDLPGEGLEKEQLIMARVGQQFFRSSVLSSYSKACCITGINIPELLIASHIVPWSSDIRNRMNPSNGLCLNSLHDKAFDKGLITITPDYTVKLSERLQQHLNAGKDEYFFKPYE